MLQAITVCVEVLFAQDTNSGVTGQKRNRNNHQSHCSLRQIMRILLMASLHTLHNTSDNPEENRCPGTAVKLYESILNTGDILAWMMISQVHPLFPVLQ